METQQRIWLRVNTDTRALIDKALHAEGLESIDDLVKKVTNEIEDGEKRAKVKEVGWL